MVFLLDAMGDPSAAPGPTPNTFRFIPGRIHDPPSPVIMGSQDGRAGVLSVVWVLEYSATANQRLSGNRVVDRWVELTYHLRHPALRFQDLPAANVTMPAAPNLILARTWSVGSLGGTELRLGLEDVSTAGHTFGGVFQGPSLSLASGGQIDTHLRSDFHWNSGDRYFIDLHASVDFMGSIALSWDTRFGSLYPRLA